MSMDIRSWLSSNEWNPKTLRKVFGKKIFFLTHRLIHTHFFGSGIKACPEIIEHFVSSVRLIKTMGKGGQAVQFTSQDVAKHSDWRNKDTWLVYKGKVYDVGNFIKRHPGGNSITLYAGQDATTVIDQFHKDHKTMAKWMKPMCIGECPDLAKPDPITADFNKLTEELRAEGKFESNKWFYFGMFAHIVALEALGQWYVMAGGMEWGGYLGYWGLALVLAIAQAQAGWLQHDFGHQAVFESYWLNYIGHQITISHMKAASRWWWTSRHQRHHAKPNIIKKDPDIDAPLPLFVFGEAWFDAGRYYFRFLIPIQKYLWFFVGPPVVTTVLFVAQNLWYVINRRRLGDFLWMSSYFVRFYFQYGPYIGIVGCVKLYYATRIIETQWFTWVTSMNHLPRTFYKDRAWDWFSIQLATTQNVEPGWFNDWFTGHLNYQIEHHLWPTMPRHNYYSVSPRVRALAEKHGIEYRVHGIFESCVDIVERLGEVSKSYVKWVKERKMKKVA